ncbi:MAG: ATP-binding protein [Trueperella sp.]|uniref:ATP-binding protein n=1 Tax=Trueperella sp. TaxID=2699835 RepID=UPI002A910F91|nr:ATP-binding protein [Trueperella sp.]MDY5403367.1 ATP-binding protein [Trueperella sp.]
MGFPTTSDSAAFNRAPFHSPALDSATFGVQPSIPIVDARPLDVVMLGTDPLTASVPHWLAEGLRGECIVHHMAGIEELREREGELDELAVITLTVDKHGLAAHHPVYEFITEPGHEDIRVVLLTTEREVSGLSTLADSNRLDLLAYLPDVPRLPFTRDIRTQLRRYRKNTRVKAGGRRERATVDERFALNLDASDLEIVHRIVELADELLGYQPRVHHPPNTRLTTEGERVEEITLALSGQVALEMRSDVGAVTMHRSTTGRLIGMLALTSGRNAFFTSRTTTNVVAVQLTFEQMNYIWSHSSEIPSLVAALFVRSFDRRLRRSEDIQIEQVELTAELERERANLAQALSNLEAARAELMSQARFASLGELAAGVAHELNNPMAAIERIGDHLYDDVHALARTAKDQKWARRVLAAMDGAHGAASLTTREERQVRRELEKALGDRAAAQRLVLAGIHDPAFATEIKRSRGIDVETVELAASIGTGLRNISTATHRVTELVASLRSYARPDGDPITDVDVHVGLDDTLRLVSHRLLNVKVERDFHTIPHITGNPGQLSQVWTNLITNAAEAMADQPDARIRITTGVDGPNVIVAIADNGPGIAPEIQKNMFEPRFTTKGGQVRFGMGIGLSVVRNMVSRHGGTVRVDTGPGSTTFTVSLPIAGPPAATPGTAASPGAAADDPTAIHRPDHIPLRPTHTTEQEES